MTLAHHNVFIFFCHLLGLIGCKLCAFSTYFKKSHATKPKTFPYLLIALREIKMKRLEIQYNTMKTAVFLCTTPTKLKLTEGSIFNCFGEKLF